MTQRDWQKDMEHAQFFKVDQYNGWAEPMIYWLQEAKKWRERYEQRPTFELLEAAQSLYEHHNARADAAEAKIKELERELNSKKQLLRETDQSRTEVREMYRSVCDVAQEYKDNLELAEGREQRLKEAIEELLSLFTLHSTWASVEDYYGSIYSLTDTDSEIVLRINSLVTLYPDTPAPKEGSS